MNTAKSPYYTIYHRLLDTAVNMMMDHPRWDAQHAVNRASETSPLLKHYYGTLNLKERLDLERRVKAQRKTRIAEWEQSR